MKILFTGGGTGGHFYPIIAVAEEVLALAEEKRLIAPELFYVGVDPYDEKLLYENGIRYLHAPAGKLRRYPSLKNVTDLFKTAYGFFKALSQLFSLYPDVVFSKGGFASIPTVLAARVLGIPIVIHESDAIPGRANMLAARFAYRIALSYPQALDYFPKKWHEKIAVVGVPIRKEITHLQREGAHEFLGFVPHVPTLLIMGGSQGAKRINDTVLEALPELVAHYQIIHQTGRAHEEEVQKTAAVILEKNPHRGRYKAYGYLDDLALRMAAGASDLIVARAGSTTIFEAAAWQKPLLLIPISEAVSRDQRKNAYAAARAGFAVVVEENNLTPHLLVSEIARVIGDDALREQMARASAQFYRPDAARKIAEVLLGIALRHERYS